MIGAYIIYSKKLNRFYIGSTTDINQRIILQKIKIKKNLMIKGLNLECLYKIYTVF